MNYEEFKKEIERISYLSIKNIEGNGVYIYSSLGENVLTVISILDTSYVDYNWRGRIKACDIHVLTEAVEKFAETPYEERFPKNYYLLIGENYVSGITFTYPWLSADCEPEEPIEVTFNEAFPHLFTNRNKEQASKMLDAAKIKHTWEVV
ncbi:hypothetical protein [Enterococcus phage Entf1]|nr:hypothetical protein [Enterococcus phage Entf1]